MKTNNHTKEKQFATIKAVLKLICLLAIMLFNSNIASGQVASATWSLATNTNASVSGNVTATSLVRGTGLADGGHNSNYYYSRAYNQTSLANAISSNDYIQFTVSPANGYKLNITSLSFGRGVSGGTINISVLFSSESTFASYATVGSTSFNNTSTTLTTTTYSGLNFNINTAQTLYVRIYGWNLGTSNYFRTNNIVISGTTTALACAGTPAPGNTVTISNPVCVGSTFCLSPQTSTQGTGVTYQWQKSVNGTSYNNVTTAGIMIISSDFAAQPANTNVYGNASVTGNVLRLTSNAGSLTGGFVIQQSPGINITPFSASFNYRIFDGGGADGMSLSYAPNINNDAGAGEAGEGSGIILSLDTYDNGGTGTNSQIVIYYGGTAIWSNALGFFNLRNTNYRAINLDVSDGGYLSLSIAGTQIVTGLLLPGYAAADKSNWKFKFSARTGGVSDMHSIDDLQISIGNNATLITTQAFPTYYRCNVTCSGNTGASTPVLVNIKPAFTTSYNDITCFGAGNGQISINVTNASGTYEYSLDNGSTYLYNGTSPKTISGLNPGNYKIRVKDANGCQSIDCP